MSKGSIMAPARVISESNVASFALRTIKYVRRFVNAAKELVFYPRRNWPSEAKG